MNNGKLIVASSSECSDLLYITNFMAPDPFIFFSSNKIKGVVVTALELKRARSECKKDITVFDRDEVISKSSPDKDIKMVLKGLVEKFPADTWEVPATFPLLYAEYLKSLGVSLKCVDGEFFPKRQTKSQEELDLIFNSVKLTEKTMHRAEDILRESTIRNDGVLLWNGDVLTSEIIKREINLEAVRCDAIAESTIVACGKHSSEPHNTGSGPIVANQPIVIDIFPRHEKSGYWGDMTRTFVKGKASEMVKKAYDAVRDARDKAKSEIKAGALPSVVHNGTMDILTERGFKTGKDDNGNYYGFFHGLGHGVGLDIHEKPGVNALNNQPFKVNDVVTVEPGVYYPEWGGIRLEDLVVVKENGIDCFTEYDNILEID